MNYEQYLEKIRNLPKEDQETLAVIGLLFATRTYTVVEKKLKEALKERQIDNDR